MDTREFLKSLVQGDDDRSPPIHFAGRRTELDLILSRAAKAGRGAGLTVVLQGAPGAGKTALLREAAKRFDEFDEGAPNQQAIFMPTPWTRDDEPAVLEQLAGAMFDEAPDSFRTTETTTRSGAVSGGVAKANLSSATQRRPVTLSGFPGFRNHYGHLASDARRVLLLIDEGQRLQRDASQLVYQLHGQEDLPVLMVFGGLSNTSERLIEVGLSRLGANSVVNVGALALADVRESAEQALRWTLDRCREPPIRHSDAQVGEWADGMAEKAKGWPQHLTSYIRGAWMALADAERLDLSRGNLAATLEAGAASAANYYAGRLVAAKVDVRVAREVHLALAGNSGFDLAAAAVEEAVEKLPAPSRRRHERQFGDDVEACLSAMLQAGLIAVNQDGTLVGSPIPTMTTYLESVAEGLL